MKKSLSQLSLLSIAIAFAIGLQYVHAWTGPTAQPPNNNISVPINVGTTAQVKDGGLGVLGNFYSYQRIGIGTNRSSPQYSLDLGTDSVSSSAQGIRFADGTVQTTAAGGMDILHVRDEKAAGTAGGTFTAGAWVTRTLNTVKANAITGASLSSNRITLPAGTYYIDAAVPAGFVEEHASRLQNITDATTAVIGTSGWVSSANGNFPSLLRGRFTISAQKTFEVQHRSTASRSTDGLGHATGLQTEVYTDVVIWKLD